MSNHLGTFNIIVIYLPLLALLRCISRHAYHPTQYHSASDKAYVSHSCFRPLVPPLCGGQCLAHFLHHRIFCHQREKNVDLFSMDLEILFGTTEF